MYIKDKRYTYNELASEWLEQNPTYIKEWEQKASDWFCSWVAEHKPEAEYKGCKFDPFKFAQFVKVQMNNHFIKQIEDKHFIECSHTKGWLKRYRNSPQYKEDLIKIQNECQAYQALLNNEFDHCDLYVKLKEENDKKEFIKLKNNMINQIKNQYYVQDKQEFESILDFMDLKEYLDDLSLEKSFLDHIVSCLTTENIKEIRYHFEYRSPERKLDESVIITSVINSAEKVIKKEIRSLIGKHQNLASYAAAKIKLKKRKLTILASRFPELNNLLATRLEKEFHITKLFHQTIEAHFNPDQIISYLLENPAYADQINILLNKIERRAMIGKTILDRIPEKYEDMYPAARRQSRHFILHLGPTNAGKTYNALEAFRGAQTGIYLAPLRLLAYEIYEESNRKGCPCNMITGEEELFVSNATHTACTIEMADLKAKYDVCVIDEAQMISEKDRGGAWTAAILGICANTIHICAAPNAKEILVKLIELCNDTYEICEHKRFVPLEFDKTHFKFPKSVKHQDALIVFSKKSVLQVAAELQKNRFKVSVIYGSLPYEARRREVERFINGDTDVVVSTDAIGMGMNLPVKRIVFLETEKFDGIQKRELNEQEVKQIAGRAGRRGLYDIGYYSSEYNQKKIKQKTEQDPEYINHAMIDFPETLLSVDGDLSDLLEQWYRIPNQDILHKRNHSVEIKLAKELELLTTDKKLIYKFITIPFDEQNRDIKQMWKQLFNIINKKEDTQPKNYMRFFFNEQFFIQNSQNLDFLELEYKKCDLLYNFLRRFHIGSEKKELLEYKRAISSKISDTLAKQKLPVRTCKDCGKHLPWNYPYGICESCYNQRYSYFDYNYDYDYDFFS